MPNTPKKRNRPWVKNLKQHERVIDMSWFYNDTRWRKFSKSYKLRHPLCVRCEERGELTPTQVTDHKVRYLDSGPGFNLDDLKDEYFEPLCNKDHNSKSGKEAHGYKRGMG